MALTKLSHEQLRRLRSWWGGTDPYTPAQISERVFHECEDGDWAVDEFLGLIQAMVANIPSEHRATARVRLESHGEGSGSLTVDYKRLQTEAEMQVVINMALQYLQDGDARDLAAYERVKALLAKDI